MKIDLSVKQRLLALAIASFVFVALVGAGGLVGVSYLAASSRDLVANQWVLKNQFRADMAHDALRGDVLAALVSARDAKADEAQVKKSLTANVAAFREAYQVFDGASLEPEAKALLDKTRRLMESYLKNAEQIVDLAFRDERAAQAAFPGFRAAFDALAVQLEAVSDLIEQRSQTTAAGAIAAAASAHWGIAIVTLLAAIVGFLGAWLAIRGVLKQLGGELAYAVDAVRRVAAGDLTGDVHVSREDSTSLLAAVKQMQDALSAIVVRIRQGTDAVASASSQIAAGNADLSQRTEEQASSLEETASSMEELTSTVRQNAENARHANQLAAGASEVAVQGGHTVGEVVETMSSINESSKKIVDIISVIDGIAFQTNILALNAAVEAARAGEQGRGFAVVASEVRTLAQRSAAAAKEIKALITDSVTKVEDGTALVDRAGKTMGEIVTAVKRVTDIMAEISAATDEQSAGIEQVNQAVSQMDDVTQQNAALVEEAAAAAESTKEQAENLTQAVASFRLADRAARPAAPPAEPWVERRRPDRARNVSRLTRRSAAPADGAPVPPPLKTGTASDRTEF